MGQVGPGRHHLGERDPRALAGPPSQLATPPATARTATAPAARARLTRNQRRRESGRATRWSSWPRTSAACRALTWPAAASARRRAATRRVTSRNTLGPVPVTPRRATAERALVDPVSALEAALSMNPTMSALPPTATSHPRSGPRSSRTASPSGPPRSAVLARPSVRSATTLAPRSRVPAKNRAPTAPSALSAAVGVAVRTGPSAVRGQLAGQRPGREEHEGARDELQGEELGARDRCGPARRARKPRSRRR